MRRHDSPKRTDATSKTQWSQESGAMLNAEFNWRVVMCHLGQQIADSIHMVEAGNDPLINPFTAINDGPNTVQVVCSNELQIFAEGFKPMATPNIKACRRMPERSKILIENILMKNRTFLLSDIPMRRQLFVPRTHLFEALNQFRY